MIIYNHGYRTWQRLWFFHWRQFCHLLLTFAWLHAGCQSYQSVYLRKACIFLFVLTACIAQLHLQMRCFSNCCIVRWTGLERHTVSYVGFHNGFSQNGRDNPVVQSFLTWCWRPLPVLPSAIQDALQVEISDSDKCWYLSNLSLQQPSKFATWKKFQLKDIEISLEIYTSPLLFPNHNNTLI